MKIVIAPDSFKESLSAMAVADAIEAGFKQVLPDATYVKLPMADGGGDGAVSGGCHRWSHPAGRGDRPLGNRVQGFVGLLGDGKRAVIEMAAASGLHLVAPELRNPRLTSSVGTGELILAALGWG
jgi:glycerate kinase